MDDLNKPSQNWHSVAVNFRQTFDFYRNPIKYLIQLQAVPLTLYSIF